MCGIPLCHGSLGIDEAFADVGGILAFGNVIQRRAHHTPLPLNLMASHTGGNGVFLEEALSTSGITHQRTRLLIIDFHDQLLKGEIVKPGRARRDSPASEQAIDLDTVTITRIESHFHLGPVLVPLDGPGHRFPHTMHVHEGPHGSPHPLGFDPS